MNRTIRRVMTTTGATVGALALFTGTAAAHYCYFDAPATSKGANGQAWYTAEEMAGELAGLVGALYALEEQAAKAANGGTLPVDWAPTCGPAAEEIVAEVEENPTSLFMGPGLLAGGAVAKGKAPKHMHHLDFAAIPEECWLLLEGAG